MDRERKRMTLTEVLDRVPDSLAVAWVDTRTGELLESQCVSSEPHVSFGLEAMTSLLSAPDRAQRTVLLSATHVFIAQRPSKDTQVVLLVVCARAANIGISIAAVRSVATPGELA